MVLRVLAFMVTAVFAGNAAARDMDLLRRLDGVWANEARGCRLYMSKNLDGDDRLDMSSKRSFGVVEFRDGNIDLKYQAASCLITKSSSLDYTTMSFIAACRVKGEMGRETGIVEFSGSDRAHIKFSGTYLTKMNLVRCSK